MSESDRYVRRSSGLWTLNDAGAASGTNSQAATPARGTAPAGTATGTKDRATHFAELARADLQRGNLASAETNFRLAITYRPSDAGLKVELKRVVDTRDAERRAANKVPKR